MVPWSQQPKREVHVVSSSSTVNQSSAVTSMSTVTGLNGPESPPVLYNPTSHTSAAVEVIDEEDERCRACHAAAMFTDWPQGDKVCTNCGVVAESRVRDDRPEWKDFNEAEDLVKGLPNQGRSGMVAVDESKYLGGLQPTSLSKQAFGGENGGYGMARMRKRLRTTNKKLDRMMESMHATALKDAKLDRQIRLKRTRHCDNSNPAAVPSTTVVVDESVRPELEQVILQEEEDAHRMQSALYSEKWSLDRAITLHGQPHEQSSTRNGENGVQTLMERMDSTLRKASLDMYTAYSMMMNSARSLRLPERVQTELSHRLTRFVVRKDGFRIPGVASRMSKSSSSTQTAAEQKQTAQKLKAYNLRKQMASLSAAMIFLTARSLGWTRSIAEICTTFGEETTANKDNKQTSFIKAKHVSRAIREVQSTFPEYARSTATPGKHNAHKGQDGPDASQNDQTATANFAHHTLRRLQLPPVAEASIDTLLVRLRQEQVRSGWSSGTKLSTLCAAVAYLVCSAGAIMQRLAQQHRDTLQSQTRQHTATSRPHISKAIPKKKRCRSTKDEISEGNLFCQVKKKTKVQAKDSDDGFSNSDDDTKASDLGANALDSKEDSNNTTDSDEDEPFDVFKHAPIADTTSEKQEYELRRMWDAWAEQMPWIRTVAEVEQSCGVSRNVIGQFYKTNIFPRRHELLEVLAGVGKRPMGELTSDSGDSKQEVSLRETPLAPILLGNIATSVSLMSAK